MTRGRLLWDVDCDSAAAGAAECGRVLAALGRASRSLGAAVLLRRDLLVRLVVSAGGGGGLPGEADALAACAVPLFLPGPGGGLPLPQALARQLKDYPAEVLAKWDAIVTLRVPPGGFHCEDGANSEGTDGAPNLDAVLFHELMHALGAATSLRSTLPGTLTTEPLPANGSSFAGFSPLTAFDGRLVDTATGTLLSRTWERVVHFAADNWPDGFRGSSEAAAAHELYESATTPGGVAFSASSGILIPLDTSAKPFQNGRSLSHLPDSATAPDGLFASTAPRGPLPSSVFRHTDQGPVLQLPSPVAAMLSTLGWTTCDADPEACGTVFVGGSTEAQGGSQPAPLPVWAIALIAVAGAVALGMLVAGLFVVRSRRHKRDAPAESPKARDPEVGSVRSARTPSFDSFFLPPSPPPDRLPSPAVPAQAHLTVSRSPSSTSSQTSLSLSSSRRLPAPDIFLPRTGSADSLASRYSLDPAYPPPAQAMHPASRSLPASRMPRNLLQTSSPSSPTRSRAARSMHPAARSLPSSALRASQADAMWTTDELARYTERVMREQEMLPSGAYRPASGSLSLGSHASDSDSDSESYYSVPRRSASGGIPAGPAIIGFEELRDEPRNAPLRGGSGSLPPRRRSGPVRMQVRPGMEGGFRSLPARRYGAGSELRG